MVEMAGSNAFWISIIVTFLASYVWGWRQGYEAAKRRAREDYFEAVADAQIAALEAAERRR